MRNKVFVDTSAWYALRDEDDVNFDSAKETLILLLAERPGLVTSNHVIGETYTLLRSALGHTQATEFIHYVKESQRLERLFTPQELEEEAFEILAKCKDQDFSFVDATSFVWMKKLGLREAFAFDKHFLTAGYILIPSQ